MTLVLVREPVGTILLDVEGTTTPLAFVQEVLFGFVRSQLRQFLEQEANSGAVLSELARLRQENLEDCAQGLAPPPLEHGPGPGGLEAIADYIVWLMDRDRKSAALKSLQGRIWERGYRRGQLRSQVFADVRPALERWRRQERRLAIFSSGSVLAQRLLFAHTAEGDLTPFISHYFDTATGPKTEVHSYQSIARQLGETPSEILFISDVVRELEAASAAGCQVLLSERAGNQPQPLRAHPRIADFSAVFP